MKKTFSLATLVGAVALSLVSLTAVATIENTPSTGIAECDQLIELTKKYADQIPEAQKAQVEQGLDQIVSLAKTAPEQVKAACLMGLQQIPQEMR